MAALKDKWYRIIGIPSVALISNVIFYYDMNEKHGFSFLKDYLYSVATAFCLWEIIRFVIKYTRKRFASYVESGKRIKWSAIGIVLSTIVFITSVSAFYDLTKWWGYHYTFKNYLYNNFTALTYCIIVGGIYEAIYYFNQWRNTALESEMLKKANIQSQFDTLKQQMSPHFLFNSLNALSSLMRRDVDRAELFLDELSRVYRYLLRNTGDTLIDLETEIQFIQSYFHLLTTRYVDAISLQIDVAERYMQYQIPPLTLQLLVENAVKHNIIDKTTPLMISIKSIPGDQLQIRNNLQRKKNRLPSTKIGLTNITTRYQLLGALPVNITETENEFNVEIPLLKNKSL